MPAQTHMPMSRLRLLSGTAALLASLLPSSVALAQAAELAVTPVAAPAAPSPWSVRFRATYIETVDNSSSAILGKDTLSVSDELIPEFDINYRLNDTWSVELVLTVPQEHTVDLKGVGEIGDFKHLPPTLLLKYHPQIGNDTFRPYIGAGVNLTLIMDDNLGGAELDSYSVGPAGQIGCDVKLADRWTLNFDVKRVMIRSDVEVGGTEIAEVRLDPWLYAIGLEYAF